MINDRLIIRPLPRAHSIAHDIVDGELDELGSLLAPPLALGTHVREASLDVSNLPRAQLVLEIEVLRDEGLDLLADGRAIGFGRRSIGTLLSARIGLQPEHLADKLRAKAVALAQFLNHVELDRELRDLHPVLVLRRRLREGRSEEHTS